MKSIDPSLTTGLKMIPSINSDQITAITTGSDGAIYVSGYTYRNLDGQTNNGNWDAFITKYLPDGTKSWTNLLGGSDYDQAIAITTGSDGAIYVGGYTGGDMDGQTNNGSADVFITKYLPDGTKSWTNLLGGSEHDQFTSLTTDSDGAIYVSGYTYGDIDGQTNNGGADAFITKYLPDGTKSWTNLFEGSDYNIAAGMTTGGDCATYPSYIDSNLDEETNNGIDDGSNGIDDGSNGIDDGSNGIDDGSNGIDDGSNGIDDGSNGIDDGLNGIDDGLNGIDDGLNGIDDCLNGIDDGLNGIDDGLITIDNSLNGIDDGLNGIDDGLITIDDGLITIDDGLITIDDGLIPKPWECGTITNDDGLITIDDGLITIDDGLIPKQWECGTIEWTYLFGGRRDDFTNAITTGSDGAIYISGYSYGDLNVNGQTYSGGYYDAFITKYLPDGTKAWTNVLGGGSDYDQITSMKTGSDGAIYVSGYTYGDMDGQTYNGNGDAFITKYLPDGTKSWTNLLGGSDYDQATAMTTSSDGAIYISGSTGGDLDGQTNNGGGDAFITKYLPDGTKSWTNLLGSSDYDQVTAMITGSDGAIYVSGYTYGNLDGQTNNGGGDAFITKYLPDGTKSWTNLLGSSSFDNATALNTDSDGAIYVNGYTYGDLDGQTNNGYYNAFITKYLPDGTKSWTNLLGGSDYDQNTDIQIAICFDYPLYSMDGQTYNGGDAFITKLSVNNIIPTITLAVSPSSVLENGTTNLVYTFTRTGDTTNALNVNYNVGGTATFNTDYIQTGAASYTNTTGAINFAAGATTATLTINPTADTTVESDETVALTLATGTGYTIGTTTPISGTITNDDTSVTLAVSPSNVTEDGTTNLVYTFTRTGVTTNALTVNYNVSGTATFNNDYTQIGAASHTATKGTITFAAGATTATLAIDPTADTTVENNETVALTLATGTGYTIGTTTAVTGTIANDDTSVTLAVSPSNVTEDGTTNLVYTFTRTGVTTNALTVNYNVSGTATFNNDYTQIGAASHTATKGTITFAAGATTATLAIDPTADTTVENNETVALTLATGTGYTIGTTTAVTGTITNDDLPSINLSPNQTVVEGNTSPQSVTYTVTLSNPSTQSITVKYATANGTATSGLDYTSKSGTLTFAPGVTNQSLNIPILNNNLNEADETFSLQLTAPTNAVLGANSTVSTTITDTLTASVTTTLPTNVENLTLTGTGAIKATGNAGNNIITGNSANNTLAGLNGNDTYFFVAKTALGTDTIIETTTGGIDTLGFTGTTTAINVNLGVSTLQRVNSNLKLILSANNVIENATGGTGNDRITGNILNNTLNGGDGNDQLQGLEGNDSLWGGAGNDILSGGSGDDSLWGGAGNDILSGGSGDDSLWGGASNDILMGGVGNDKYLFQSSSVFATSLGIDYISEFEAGLDQIVLSKTTFNAITNTVGQALTDFAVVTDDEFVNASNAHIVFSQGTGSLFYNQDANLLGANTVFEFARLGNPDITLSSSNFSLVV